MNEHKKYRIIIRSIGTDGEEKEEFDKVVGSVFALADSVDGDSFAEIILHDNIVGIASKLTQGKKTKYAVKIANMLMSMKEDGMSDLEDMLSDAIGGIQ